MTLIFREIHFMDIFREINFTKKLCLKFFFRKVDFSLWGKQLSLAKLHIFNLFSICTQTLYNNNYVCLEYFAKTKIIINYSLYIIIKRGGVQLVFKIQMKIQFLVKIKSRKTTTKLLLLLLFPRASSLQSPYCM